MLEIDLSFAAPSPSAGAALSAEQLRALMPRVGFEQLTTAGKAPSRKVGARLFVDISTFTALDLGAQQVARLEMLRTIQAAEGGLPAALYAGAGAVGVPVRISRRSAVGSNGEWVIWQLQLPMLQADQSS